MNIIVFTRYTCTSNYTLKHLTKVGALQPMLRCLLRVRLIVDHEPSPGRDTLRASLQVLTRVLYCGDSGTKQGTSVGPESSLRAALARDTFILSSVPRSVPPMFPFGWFKEPPWRFNFTRKCTYKQYKHVKQGLSFYTPSAKSHFPLQFYCLIWKTLHG